MIRGQKNIKLNPFILASPQLRHSSGSTAATNLSALQPVLLLPLVAAIRQHKWCPGRKQTGWPLPPGMCAMRWFCLVVCLSLTDCTSTAIVPAETRSPATGPALFVARIHVIPEMGLMVFVSACDWFLSTIGPLWSMDWTLDCFFYSLTLFWSKVGSFLDWWQ